MQPIDGYIDKSRVFVKYRQLAEMRFKRKALVQKCQELRQEVYNLTVEINETQDKVDSFFLNGKAEKGK